MASDVVHDLDLDQAQDKIDFAEIRSNQDQMAAIRAYLACYYLCPGLSATWRMPHTLPYSQWTASCCDLLGHNGYGLASIHDQTLSWLVRLGHLVDETVSLNKQEGQLKHDQTRALVEKGLESQLREWQNLMTADLLSQRKSSGTLEPNH